MFQQLELIRSKSSVRLGILNLRNTGGSYMYMYMQQGNINATTNKFIRGVKLEICSFSVRTIFID